MKLPDTLRSAVIDNMADHAKGTHKTGKELPGAVFAQLPTYLWDYQAILRQLPGKGRKGTRSRERYIFLLKNKQGGMQGRAAVDINFTRPVKGLYNSIRSLGMDQSRNFKRDSYEVIAGSLD